jgi:hypothetical protein
MEINQPMSVKLKVREHILRSGVNWQEVLKLKGINKALVYFKLCTLSML